MSLDKNYSDDLQEEKKDLENRLQHIEASLGAMGGNRNKEPDTALLRKEHFDLKSRDHIYRMLIENMSEGAVVINSQSIVLYSNIQFAGFLGYPLQKVMGSDFSVFLDDKDKKKFSQCLEEARSQRSICILNLKSGEGTNFSVITAITPFYMEDQLYYCLIITDITFQKKIEKGLQYKIEEQTLEVALANKKLKEINKELNEMNAYLENFVHAIAHDMRAPVANLMLVEEIFRIAPDHEKPQLLDSVHNNITKLDTTLQGLVQIIDIEGRQENSKAGIDIMTVIEEVLEEEEIRIHKEASGARIEIEEATTGKINYVEGYLRSIVRNLINNALKYTVPGRTPVVKIRIAQDKDSFILEIGDNGTGIDLEKQGKKLYKPFQRLTTEGKGLGIGLHIINNMVQKNGGRIQVESEPGKGTKFTVILKQYQE